MAKRKNIWEANKLLLDSLNDHQKADAALEEIEKLIVGPKINQPRLTFNQSMEGMILLSDLIACGQVIRPKNVAFKIGEMVWDLREEIFPGKDSLAAYAKDLEDLIAQKDATLKSPEKTKQFKQLAYSLSTIVFNAGLASYEGSYLKTSQCNIENSITDVEVEPSVIIIPANPEDAVAYIDRDNTSRILYAQYDPENSAEDFVYNFYGTNGSFAEHHWSFLDCSNYYPNQKRLIS